MASQPLPVIVFKTLHSNHGYFKGVWVFVIFVCKKNVYRVITKQANKLYNNVGNTVRQMSTGEVLRHQGWMLWTNLDSKKNCPKSNTQETLIKLSC